MKTEKKDKKKGSTKQGLLMIGMFLLAAACGYLGGMAMEDAFEEHGFGITLLVFMVSGVLAAYLQTILHEAGHMLFGLLTGYRFSSFRIGSFMWILQDGKLRFRRFSLAGTGGQCLMVPPEMVDGKIPYVLYGLGGVFLNLVTAILSVGLCFLCRNIFWLFLFFAMMALMGVILALTNGIPMRLGVDNDGKNVLSVGKNPQALRAYWLQMKVNAEIARGIRLKEMPDEWFTMPSDEAMKNSMVATIAVFACNRMMDQMDFVSAQQAMESLLEKEPAGLISIYRSLLKVDIAYCEMVGENRAEVVEKLWNKEQQQFMKQMATFPSVIRTQYAHALLVEQNQFVADKLQQQFEKMAEKYPHPREIESERELMLYAKRCVENSHKS